MGDDPVILAIDAGVFFEHLIPVLLVVVVEIFPINFDEVLGTCREHFVGVVDHHLHLDDDMTVKETEIEVMVLAGGGVICHNLVPDAARFDKVELFSIRVLLVWKVTLVEVGGFTWKCWEDV